MGQLGVVNLGAIGSFGLNTQSSQIDLAPQFATEVVNAVVDEAGRLSARKSVTLYTDASVSLGSAAVERIYRHNHLDGTSTLISAGNGHIFSLSGTTLTSEHTASGATKNRWQFASLNGKLFAAQSGEDFKSFVEGTPWTASTIATPAKPNTIHSAFGRLWAADYTSNDYTLAWSVLNDGTDFGGAGSGSLDMREIFINGKDSIVGVSSLGNSIIVFCRNSIYTLGLALDLDPGNTTTPIYLADSIANIGCVSRDTIVRTGDDIYFLADDGVRSLQRSLREAQKLPMTDITVLNHTKAVTDIIRGQTLDDITAAYWPDESWYLLFLPDSSEVWVFDQANRVPELNVPRSTVWTMSNRPVYCAVYGADDTMYFGGDAGIFDYVDYDVNDSYRFTIHTGWLSLGDPAALKHFKKVLMNITGGAGQQGFIKWRVDFNDNQTFSTTFDLGSTATVYYYGVAEYNIAEYAAGVLIEDIYAQIGNSAKFIKFIVDIPVEGSQISLNNLQAFVTKGRVR